MSISFHQLLKVVVENGSSDLHITSGSPPMLRIDGKLVPVKHPPLTPPETKDLCYSVLTDTQKHRFEENWELDVSFGKENLGRFRGNIYTQRGAIAGAFRLLPVNIRNYQELGLPAVTADFARKPRGLILITGPTGSGKTTTLASMVDQVNRERHEHIVTIEDPIEYIFEHRRTCADANIVCQNSQTAENICIVDDPHAVAAQMG